MKPDYLLPPDDLEHFIANDKIEGAETMLLD